MPDKLTYFFANGRADGRLTDRDRLGGKGAYLADLTRAGLPVPPGFTIVADAADAMPADGTLHADVARSMTKLEKATAKRFGDPKRPLLVAVRSGAAVSMPGMMETVLNVGLTTIVADAWAVASADDTIARFVYDSYRRLIAMYARAVDGVRTTRFEDLLFDARRDAAVDDERLIPAGPMRDVAMRSLAAYETLTGRSFPQQATEQFAGAIRAVFASSGGRRAIAYRDRHAITDARTACTVQAMVFGNAGPDSCAGVAFTRDPSSGKNELAGEFIVGAQGEDVVAGTHTPLNCRKWFPKWNRALWDELLALGRTLEARYADAQDFEFTVDRGQLFLLQTRTAKRTPAAAVRIAVEMEKVGMIDRNTALTRVDPVAVRALATALPPVFDKRHLPAAIAAGIAAAPGVAGGRLAFTAADAAARASAGERILLVRPETSADDVFAFEHVAGILTSSGGLTSHAALEARAADKPCVVGATPLAIHPNGQSVVIGTGRRAKTFTAADTLSIDGVTGRVYAGNVPTVPARPTPAVRTFLKWLDGG